MATNTKFTKNRIVIITDCVDAGANELRATLISNLEKLQVVGKVEVEPIVEAKKFSIINGAFLIRLMAEIYNPKTTIFLVVLNPLMTNRPDRARLVGRTQNGFRFVGENTGTLGWLIKDFGVAEIYETTRERLDGKKFLSFGGKFFHAPVAAKVATNIPLERLGTPFDFKRITYPDLRKGIVLHIDNFGVAKIFMKPPKIKEGTKVRIFINNKFQVNAIFTISMKNLPDNTWATYPGSSLDNLLELGIVRGDTTEKLPLKIGDVVTLRY